MPPPAKKGKPSLMRWVSEKPYMHRGLLLFAMQDEGSCRHAAAILGRSQSVVARAMGVNKRTVQRWATTRDWWTRIRHHGADAQKFAIELYQRLYMEEFGDSDIPVVGQHISLPLNQPALSEDSREEVARLVRALTPDAPGEDVQRIAEEARQKARKEKLGRNETLTGTALVGVEAIRQGLRAATDPAFAKENSHIQPLHPRVADLQPLAKLLADLDEARERLQNPEIVQAGAGTVVDSVRLRIAKETGGDQLQAILADCHEILAIGAQLQQPQRSFQELEAHRQTEAQGQPGKESADG